MVATRGGGGGGCTLIFSYIRKRRSFFWVQNFEFQYLFGFQKSKYFWGYEDFVDILFFFFGGGGGGHHKIGLHLGVISMHFWVFFKAMVQNGDILGGC